jgi:hypothetical protein
VVDGLKEVVDGLKEVVDGHITFPCSSVEGGSLNPQLSTFLAVSPFYHRVSRHGNSQIELRHTDNSSSTHISLLLEQLSISRVSWLLGTRVICFDSLLLADRICWWVFILDIGGIF